MKKTYSEPPSSEITPESLYLSRRTFLKSAGLAGLGLALAETDETGASEIELDATVEGQALEIAFNVKFLQCGLEAISTRNVVIETNAHNTPAAIRSAGREASPSGGEEDYLYVLMPMHIGRE